MTTAEPRGGLPQEGLPLRTAHLDRFGTLTVRSAAPVSADRTTPEANTLVLKTLLSSICGSDLHGFRTPAKAETHAEHEASDVIGHESVGVILQSADPRFPIGTRVLHAPVVENGRAFADRQATTGEFVVAVPDSLSDEQAVFGQQLGTVLWALKHYSPTGRLPAVALITGGGPAGLLFAQVLRARGVGTVILSEPVPWRRQLAARHGAVAIEPADVSVTVERLTTGLGAGLAIEASGAADARQQCLDHVAREGTVGVFGIPVAHESRLDLDLEQAFDRNLTFCVVQNAQLEPGLASFREALELIADGVIDVDALISHRMTLEELPEAFALAASITHGVVKVVVRIGGEGNV